MPRRRRGGQPGGRAGLTLADYGREPPRGSFRDSQSSLYISFEGTVLRTTSATVRADHDARACGFRACQRKRRGHRSGAEQALPRPQGDRVEPEPVLIDEVIRDECLSQLGAPLHTNLSPVPALQLCHFDRDIASNEAGVVPLHFAQGLGDHVLRHRIERGRDRIVRIGDPRPIRCKDLVRLASEQEGIDLREYIGDVLSHVGVRKRDQPAPVVEPAARIL